MPDHLKLTPEDIEQFQQQAQSGPLLPGVLEIPAVRGQTLVITEADLTAVSPQPVTQPELAMLEQQAFTLINQARQNHLPRWLGNPHLRWHNGLAAVSRGHATDMLQRQYIEHTTPEGTNAAKRLEQYNIRYLACGENIGVVYGAASHSADGVVEIHHAFMNQPRSLTNHRANILNPIWSHVGVGVAYAPSGTLIAVQNFMAIYGKE